MLRAKFVWSVLVMIAISQFAEASFGRLQLTKETEVSQQPSPGHRVFDANGHDYIGGNIIVGALPPGYEDFLIMWVDYQTHPSSALSSSSEDIEVRARLMPDSEGRITVAGRVVFKGPRYPEGDGVSDGKYKSYEFKGAYLIEQTGRPVKLFFDTEVINGMSYHFEGAHAEASATGSQEKELHLTGQMTQFTNDMKRAATNLTFSPVHRDSD